MTTAKEFDDYARAELENPEGDRRAFALHYLSNAFPKERERLFEKMSKDTDSLVLLHAGEAILPVNPQRAVKTWFKAMDDAPQGLGNEVLPALIGQYADDAFVEELRRIVSGNPMEELAAMALWHAEIWRSLEYLDAEDPVEQGTGYMFACPSCKKYVGARDGHAGEKGRCLKCQHEFQIPERPEGG